MEGIDQTIRPLIAALNHIPFIDTLSSCGGHPEEAAVNEYGYAVANVIFSIEDEAENLIHWFDMVQEALRRRKTARPIREYAFIFAKTFSLNSAGYLGWQWELKIQATGKEPEECRAGLDEGIAFLAELFNKTSEGDRA